MVRASVNKKTHIIFVAYASDFISAFSGRINVFFCKLKQNVETLTPTA